MAKGTFVVHDATTSALLEMIYIAEVCAEIGRFSGSLEILYRDSKVTRVVDGEYCTVTFSGCHFESFGENTTVTCEMRRMTEFLPWHIVKITLRNQTGNLEMWTVPGALIPNDQDSYIAQHERLVIAARTFVREMLGREEVVKFIPLEISLRDHFVDAFLPLPTIGFRKPSACLAITFRYIIPRVREVVVVHNATSITPVILEIRFVNASNPTKSFTLLKDGVVINSSGE